MFPVLNGKSEANKAGHWFVQDLGPYSDWKLVLVWPSHKTKKIVALEEGGEKADAINS